MGDMIVPPNVMLATLPESGGHILPTAASLVHNLIHDRAKVQPNAESVCSRDCTLSYRELDSLSSRLASYLASNGVGPEVVVPLFFEKSGWAVVSMLAVMKAGGAFLPLDVSQPKSRLRSIIEQTGAKIALSSAATYEFCASLMERVFAVTEPAITDLTTAISHWPAALNNAAYVMATSGSTGKPKEIITEHSQLASFVAYLTKPLGFSDTTRTFQFASYAFDPIIGDIFLTLAAGGTVCVPSEDERRNDIVGAMRRMRVTLAKFTPSLVGSLTDLTPASVPTLKTLVLGGETAPATVVEAWADNVDLKLIYGSTECTISCMLADASTRAVVPGEIGRPIGSQAWVVDSDNIQKLIQDGETGELVLGGPLVSRGYMNNPSQTEARFIHPPTWSKSTKNSSQTNSRLYRTGDLVRRLGNGNLVYVGRVDNQIKIRGQRLELEEVEHHLRQALSDLPDSKVKGILVDATTPVGSATVELVAFLALEDKNQVGSLRFDDERGATIDLTPTTQHAFAALVSKLEGRMRSIVPSYMVPSLWIPIDEMPYTLSRKRDRQRLRKAIQSLPTSQLAAFSRAGSRLSAAPESAIRTLTGKEMLLQKLWSDILNLETHSIHPTDNFFHLGGNSLLALRLISMAREAEQNLTVDEVLASPILQDLASKLTPAKACATLAPFALLDLSQALAIQKEAAQQCGLTLDSIEDIYPLYSMQVHYITGYPELGRAIEGPWNWQQQIVFQLPDTFDIPLFKSVWSTAVDHYPQLRTRVVRTSHGMFQVALRKEFAPTWKNVEDLDDYVLQDRRTLMSFGDELLRLTIATSGQKHHFVFTMQHLIYDAYARDKLFMEIDAAFLRRGLPASDPPPHRMNQFIDYVRKADRNSAIDFWSSYLAGSSTRPLLSKPIGSRVDRLHVHSISLDKPTPLPSWKWTLPTVVEVSGALALGQRLDCSDVIFYADRAGRNLPITGIQDLIGPTTLLLPLRVHIDPSQTVYDLLCAHQAAHIAMIPFEHLGWTELRNMDHLKGILQHSLNLNINPFTPYTKLGANIGLQVVGDHETCDDPFGINVLVGGEQIEWALYYDENFISHDVVRELVGDFKESFLSVLEACTSQKTSVGDVLDRICTLARSRA